MNRSIVPVSILTHRQGTNSFADLGLIEFTPAEWKAFKLLIGSGVVEAASAGITANIIEEA